VVESDKEIDIGGACFDLKTRVLMADGGLKEISDIREGQLVKSYNIEKGTVDDRRVTKTYMLQTEGYYLINGELKATAKHKFLMAGDENIWKKAYELEPWDMVKSLDGKIIIRSAQNLIEKDNYHNFLIADKKAYIVKGGNNYYVVHNGL
jgi:hypothetical protein